MGGEQGVNLEKARPARLDEPAPHQLADDRPRVLHTPQAAQQIEAERGRFRSHLAQLGETRLKIRSEPVGTTGEQLSDRRRGEKVRIDAAGRCFLVEQAGGVADRAQKVPDVKARLLLSSQQPPGDAERERQPETTDQISRRLLVSLDGVGREGTENLKTVVLVQLRERVIRFGPDRQPVNDPPRGRRRAREAVGPSTDRPIQPDGEEMTRTAE